MEDADVWMKKAEEDLDTAVFNEEGKKYSYAAFLYQQVVEKSFKALLIKRKNGLPKIHDCFVLARSLGAPPAIVQYAEVVSPYYSRTRYPDALLIEVTKEECARLHRAAQEVVLWIKKSF